MEKKQLIEAAAKELAREKGLINITRKEVCDKVGISDGSFHDIMDESFTDFIGRLEGVPMGEPTDRKRTSPNLRRKHVLDVALELAKTKGYNTLTRNEVAAGANVTPGLITHYFQSTEALRVVILKTAVSQEVLEVVAQGLTHKDPIAVQAPKELKDKAVAYLAGL